MRDFFASILSALGFGAAGLGSEACMSWIWDEEEMPKSLKLSLSCRPNLKYAIMFQSL